MILVNPQAKIVDQEPGLLGAFKMVEKAARISHRSEGSITEGSWKRMWDLLISAKHFTPMEFGTVYLKFEKTSPTLPFWNILINNPFSRAVTDGKTWWVTTNLRVLYENTWEGKTFLFFLQGSSYICDFPEESHIKRVCTWWLCDRAIGEEALRHREIHQCSDYPEFSFLKESTRFCNYGKEKFSGVRFVIPTKLKGIIQEGVYKSILFNHGRARYIVQPLTGENSGLDVGGVESSVFGKKFLKNCKSSEEDYLSLLKEAVTPQDARGCLNLWTAGEFYMAGFVDAAGWRNFFEMRYKGTTGKPHPDMLVLATRLYDQFYKKKLL